MTRAMIFSFDVCGVMHPVAKLAFACTLCIGLIPIPASGDDETVPVQPQSGPSKSIPLPDSNIHDKNALLIGSGTDENDDPVNESKKRNQNDEKNGKEKKKIIISLYLTISTTPSCNGPRRVRSTIIYMRSLATINRY